MPQVLAVGQSLNFLGRSQASAMSDTARLRDDLLELVTALTECREFAFANLVESAATGSDSRLLSFLSGELWGGAGSVSDQAGYREGERTDERRKIEAILIRIGKRQMQAGIVNGRATHLVRAFEDWAKSGI